MAQLNRRGFLAAMTAAGAAFGFPLVASAAMDPTQANGVPLQPEGVRFDPSVWYWIDGTGHVNVHITRAEMGQHIGTAIARILADDLGADWSKVSIEHVDTEAKYGFFVTGGSWSVMQSWDPYRRAGTAGRIALAEKAAELWGVSVDDVKIENGVATAAGNSATIGELVTAGISRTFTDEELAALPLKAHSEMSMIGKEVAALDVDGKTTGKAIFGIDAKIEGMVHGAPLLPPTRYGSKVTSIDDSAAKDVKGYQQTIALEDSTGHAEGWVMVIADSFWGAKKAASLVKVTWDSPKAITVQEADIQAESRRLIADASTGAILDMGDSNVDPVFEGAASVLESEFTTSTVLHFQMEPLNATAFRNAEGVWEIHTGNQWQSMTQPWVEAALGVEAGKVIMRSYMLGGGFGRRLGGDYAIPAALASKALDGKPVKVVLSREQDVAFDSVRSPSVSKLRMAFDADKKVIAMDTAFASGWPTKAHAPEAMAPGTNGVAYDPFAIDGADHWYDVGAHRVRAISNELALETFRPGWLRSVSPGWVNFALESFMDEAAAHAGVDPVEFRLAHFTAAGINAGSVPLSVGGATRQANVLKRLVEKVGPGEGLPADTAIGYATTYGQSRSMPTWTACAAQVHVNRETGDVSVQKLWLVIDCGTVVDPDGALAQTQGGALWGMSMGLFEGTEIENGLPKARNLDGYTPLRLQQAPEMEIEFVDSTEAPVGLGEPGTTVVAPAIANAIFKAVGARMRHLPMRPADVLAAINA